MTVAELLEAVQFITDAEGNKKAAVVDWPTWEEIVAALEDMEDSAELLKAKKEADSEFPWEQIKADYQANHPDANV